MPKQQQRSWWARLFTRRGTAELDPDRLDLIVVASSFDDAEAASTTLTRAEQTPPVWESAQPVVLRHHIVLPAAAVDDAVAVAAQDGYGPAPDGAPLPDEVPEPDREVVDATGVILQRVQVLDALHCSQERSRMAGLAQRRGGVVLGWDALQPPRPE